MSLKANIQNYHEKKITQLFLKQNYYRNLFPHLYNEILTIHNNSTWIFFKLFIFDTYEQDPNIIVEFLLC
jgi:hypothetical protein